MLFTKAECYLTLITDEPATLGYRCSTMKGFVRVFLRAFILNIGTPLLVFVQNVIEVRMYVCTVSFTVCN